ncbi:dTDP-glucose 4,6-dehydratase, partial [Pseudomonas sp. MPR-R5A]
IKEHPRHTFIEGNITDRELIVTLIKEHKIDAIVNFAAESHVDRSILNPGVFIETNVQGTLALLDAAKECQIEKFVQVSTDEVYGSLG